MRILVTGGSGFIGWRVVRALLDRNIAVVAADLNPDPVVRARLAAGYGPLVEFATCDVSEFRDVASIFHRHPGITHALHLAYLMSAEVEANPHLGVRVNILGMVNLFEAALQFGLRRLVFTSSETVYGGSQAVYGDRPVVEKDFCPPSEFFFTYGIMKQLNEFMGERFARKHGLSIACTRPPVVFGHGRKRGSALWAEHFLSLPAIGEPVSLPFASTARDYWVYVDDCAEQLIRLLLKPEIAHFAYNNTGETVTAAAMAALVRHWIPDARIAFDESIPSTPLVDCLDGSRLEREIGFTPRPLRLAVLAHINEARAEAGLPLIAEDAR